ncbi:MAG: tRNA (adenine-N1)-methyltransferase [Nitrososphaeria archaeon]|nr:tRNA (adenine-N1)-methyltransferase [Nitrososphaerota archaeon]
MSSDVVSEGDTVLLLAPKGVAWLVRVSRGSELHTHLGIIRHDDLIGRPYGSPVESQLGGRLHLLRPSLEDFIMLGERPTQIVYPKDMGLIVARIGAMPGSRVLEVGTGSGALTMFLAAVVAPEGRVHSYEVRPEFADAARRNLERAGLSKYVEIKVRDASTGVDERGVDAAVVDVGDALRVLGAVHEALRPSGGLAVIAPTFNQVERIVSWLRSSGYVRVEAFETTYRRIESKPGATRPSSSTVAHTTFVVTARRTLGGPAPA